MSRSIDGFSGSRRQDLMMNNRSGMGKISMRVHATISMARMMEARRRRTTMRGVMDSLDYLERQGWESPVRRKAVRGSWRRLPDGWGKRILICRAIAASRYLTDPPEILERATLGASSTRRAVTGHLFSTARRKAVSRAGRGPNLPRCHPSRGSLSGTSSSTRQGASQLVSKDLPTSG